jgi:hypothetical protein
MRCKKQFRQSIRAITHRPTVDLIHVSNPNPAFDLVSNCQEIRSKVAHLDARLNDKSLRVVFLRHDGRNLTLISPDVISGTLKEFLERIVPLCTRL